MAKLVAVCRDDEFPFERRQIPLTIEETLTMVMEIPETVISAECVSSADVSQFIKRYSCLSQSEMNSALTVKQKELFSLLAVSVPCVGCRRSVERLYSQLWESGQPAIEPLIIATSGVLTLSESFLSDAKLIYALFYIHGSHLNDIVDTIPKSRRNRRCILHSLETHKARASGWMDVWDLLSQECRDEVVLIDSDSLLDTLESYLRKHRFCSECKSKVLKAYSILAGDIVGDAERGYCSGLYEGLKSCPKERHIHVVCDTDFIAHLIGRAEPELAGGRRERHARTIDIAQEEVLTCLGIHLWERLHRLWQKLRAEEQTWQMLFYLGVEALRKSFETAVEDKQGITQLELVVEEISEAERVKEQRKENKRLKKKKRKENKAKLNEEKMQCNDEPNEEKCPIDGSTESNVEYAESVDSEKSSTDSQTSPRKIEANELESDIPSDASLQNSQSSSCGDASLQNSQSSSCGSSLDDKSAGLLKCVNGHDSKSRPCDKDDTVDSLKQNSSHPVLNGQPSVTHNKSATQPENVSCKNPPKYSCQSKGSMSHNKISAESRSKVTESHNLSDMSHKCHIETKQEFSKESVDDCKCESSNASKHHKRNGFVNHHQDYRGQYKPTHNKRNGYSDCKVCLNVGPRFNRYEDQSRWKGNDHHGDVYDKVNSINGSIHNGRGRGKRKGYGTKHKEYIDGKTDFYESKPGLHHNQSNHQKSQHHQQQQQHHVCTSDEVEDADELRLLKMMGWTIEDSHGISEQEIQEFTANRPEVQTRREELRDKLRKQFDKLCVNKVFLY